MSFKCMPLMVYGYAGTREHVGACLRAFAEYHGITQDDCTDSQLPVEILTSFRNEFLSQLKKSHHVIDLMAEESYCTQFDYFFGFAWRNIGNVTHEEMRAIQDSMVAAFEKTMDGVDFPTPTFSNVLWLY